MRCAAFSDPLAEGRNRLVGVVELPADRPRKSVVEVKEPAYVVVFASHSDPLGSAVVIADPRGESNTVHYECFGVSPHQTLEAWASVPNRQIFP